MKYSVKIEVFTDNADSNVSDAIIEKVNNYQLWKLTPNNYKSRAINKNIFSVESWLNSEEDKNSLFNELKQFVVDYGGVINSHRCTHDEENPQPCVIEEEFRNDG